LWRATQTIEHRQFTELETLLKPGDLVVLNDTRVLPARKFSDDGAIEFLFTECMGSGRWKCLVKPGRKMRPGATARMDSTTLHVGTGTFLPVRSQNISAHHMHPEQFSISPGAAEKIDNAKRTLAVGTTIVRVLESARRQNGKLLPQAGSTDLFIYPPYRFQHVDLLLTI